MEQHHESQKSGPPARWPSPDPAGIAAAIPANPQSWNRYAYVLNNPLSLVDPSGMGQDCKSASAYSCLVANGIAFTEFGSPPPFDQSNEFQVMNIQVVLDLGWYYVSTFQPFPGYPDGYTGEADLSTPIGNALDFYNLLGLPISLGNNPGSLSSSPQTPTAQPQTPTPPKKPCTEIQNQAKGIATLAEGQHLAEAPFLFGLFPAGSAAVLGGMGTATGYACGVPEPGWVFACGGMAAVDIVGGGAIVVGNYFYFKNAGSIWKKLTSSASPPSSSDTCGGG